jgi:hypothetical protein
MDLVPSLTETPPKKQTKRKTGPLRRKTGKSKIRNQTEKYQLKKLKYIDKETRLCYTRRCRQYALRRSLQRENKTRKEKKGWYFSCRIKK